MPLYDLNKINSIHLNRCFFFVHLQMINCLINWKKNGTHYEIYHKQYFFEYPMNKYIQLKIYTLQIGTQLHCNPWITTIGLINSKLIKQAHAVFSCKRVSQITQR